MNRNDLEKLLEGLSPRELRVLVYRSQNHYCEGKPQIRCCGEFRCEQCHVDHLRSIHKKSLQAGMKLHSGIQLTWKGGPVDSKPIPTRTHTIRKPRQYGATHNSASKVGEKLDLSEWL